MNFDEAIRAHSDWKMKLQQYLANPDNSIDVVKLSQDNQCNLGGWIHSEGLKNFGALPEFKTLMEEHKAFHKSAADIVTRKNKGEDVQADTTLGANSPFASHSSAVVSAIMAMKRHVPH